MKEFLLLVLLCSLMFWSGCGKSGKKPAADTEGPAPSTQTAAPSSKMPAQQTTAVPQSETPLKPAISHSQKLPRAASPLTWIGLAAAVCLGGGIYLKLFLRWLR